MNSNSHKTIITIALVFYSCHNPHKCQNKRPLFSSSVVSSRVERANVTGWSWIQSLSIAGMKENLLKISVSLLVGALSPDTIN